MHRLLFVIVFRTDGVFDWLGTGNDEVTSLSMKSPAWESSHQPEHELTSLSMNSPAWGWFLVCFLAHELVLTRLWLVVTTRRQIFDNLHKYNQGLGFYRDRNWVSMFPELCRTLPELSQMFLEGRQMFLAWCQIFPEWRQMFLKERQMFPEWRQMFPAECP